mmetsp:Transcript_25998/g.42498  ORF Transcript_25998/g.42498 Transcript_25998/m.42498 type:complete len:365 (+) Transcript_25998:148-1242(+)
MADEERGDSVESMDEEEMNMMMADAAGETGPLFWSMKLEANKPTEIAQPAIEGYIIHVTNACFGEQVQKQSRTLVFVNVTSDEDDDVEDAAAAAKDDGAPICVLRQGSHESQSLDLLFNESAVLTLKGQKPSIVYLTGYLQPPIDDAMNSMLEDDDDEAIQRVLARQEKLGKALDDEEEEDDEPQLMDEAEEEDQVQPAQKKQKTAAGAKVTKNGAKKDDKRKKATNADDEKEKPAAAAAAKEAKGKKGKGEKLQTMKGGIKYRDMKVGDGKVCAQGDKLKVFYVGQTDDKQVFDKCIAGTGFEFNFGKGDVIKGWEMGLKGMRVGGKRKLVIPPKLAYGASGSPPTVPPNATLTFTIEVKGAN